MVDKFKYYWKMVRPFDVIAVLLLMVFSFTPIVVFASQQAQIPENALLKAVITIDGDVVDTFPLRENGGQMFIHYTSEHGLRGNQYNIVEIDGYRIRVKEDNSPDQVAVNQGWISRPGDWRLCLPHRFMIRIVAENPLDTFDEEIIIVG